MQQGTNLAELARIACIDFGAEREEAGDDPADDARAIPPAEHVASLRTCCGASPASPDQGIAPDIFASSFFGIRHYDFVPDVMIYSRNRPPEFPKGQQLKDKLVRICCLQGDCLRWKVAMVETHVQNQLRPTASSKPFLGEFPDLTRPSPERSQAPPSSLSIQMRVPLANAAAIICAVFILP